MHLVTGYLLKHVWTKESERELYNLMALATHFACNLMEFALCAFLQDRFKVHIYHLSEEQAKKTFP